MNIDSASLFYWLCANRLSLNVGKTEFIIFRPASKLKDNIKLKINQTTIRESSKTKYLGIFIDRNLSFGYHILELCKKLSTAVGMLYNIKNIFSSIMLKSI